MAQRETQGRLRVVSTPWGGYMGIFPPKVWRGIWILRVLCSQHLGEQPVAVLAAPEIPGCRVP